MLTLHDDEFELISYFLKKYYGINLANKKTFIESRLCNHLASLGYSDFHSYIYNLFKDPTGQEVSTLIEKLTTNHTYFMRESDHFKFLYEHALPELTAQIKDYDIRTWSAGCSSGEEPYTLAMLYDRYFKIHPSYWDKKILATDISKKVLKMALNGEYPASALDSMPNDWKNDYFTRINDKTYQVADSIRQEVIFKCYNLLGPSLPFNKKLNIIFCRNVMIYFDQQTKDELIQRFYDLTEPGGYLFIGHSETIDKNSSPYKYISPSIYRKES